MDGTLANRCEYFVYHRSPTSIELVKLSKNIEESTSTEVRFAPDVFSNTILFAGAITDSPFLVIAFADFRDWRSRIVGLGRSFRSYSATSRRTFQVLLRIRLAELSPLEWIVAKSLFGHFSAALVSRVAYSGATATAVNFPAVIDVKEDSVDGRNAEPAESIGKLGSIHASIQSLTFRDISFSEEQRQENYCESICEG